MPETVNESNKHKVKHYALKVINNKHVNLIVTSCLIFISIYLLMVSVLGRRFIDPMDSSDKNNQINANLSDGIIKSNVNKSSTALSLFFLLVSALICGQLAEYISLPPLLGHLITGIAIRNIPLFAHFFQIDSTWSRFITQFAFILILIRCGLNLDSQVLRKSLGVFSALGFLSTTIEALAIVLIALVFQMNIGLAVVFGFVLASTSPAVTVPSMIQLQNSGLGTRKGIPTMILASATIDNIYCVTAFSVASSIVFASNSSLLYSILSVPVELIIGIISGVLLGLILWYIPRRNQETLHFFRSLILCSVSLAILFGTRSIGHTTVGPVAVVLMCIVVAFKWKTDNSKGVRKEQLCFKVLWEAALQPFLFALIGLLLDFSQMSWKVFGYSSFFVFIGVLIRFGSIFGMAFLMKDFNVKEKLFIAVCFFPKATVQAALAPLILQEAQSNSSLFPDSHIQLVFQTCILSILFTAPAGQLIIWQLGKRLLERRHPCENNNDDKLEKNKASVRPMESDSNMPSNVKTVE